MPEFCVGGRSCSEKIVEWISAEVPRVQVFWRIPPRVVSIYFLELLLGMLLALRDFIFSSIKLFMLLNLSPIVRAPCAAIQTRGVVSYASLHANYFGDNLCDFLSLLLCC